MADPGNQRNVGGGVALLVLGLVLLVPSGLCTGIFGGGALIDLLLHPGNSGDSTGLLMMALLFGGPVVVAGGALVWFGVALLRRK